MEYYTIGTIYSQTNKEFNTLYKNVHLAVESHLANNFELYDIPLISQPLSKLFNKFKSNPMVLKGNLKQYGTHYDAGVKSQWFVNNHQQDVILFLHGGGYALNCFDAQFAGILMIYHALPSHLKSKVSILAVDYTLTFEPNGKFPRQLYDALLVYKKLLQDGYTKIHLLGDSAGGNLAVVMARFIAYPQEAQDYFSKYDGYDFAQFTNLAQPTSCVLISPWVQPLHVTTNKRKLNNVGDLGARTADMGEWMIQGVSSNKADFQDWITLTQTTLDKFSKIDYFTNGKCLVIYGAREVLRDGIEEFNDLIKEIGNPTVILEAGGVHDAVLYVESLDYLGRGGQLAIDGKFDDKFGLTQIVDFYDKIITV